MNSHIVLVFESVAHGTCFALDGVLQVTNDQFAYAEMMCHMPMMAHPNPQRVLIVGGGDAAVLTEVLKYKGIQEVVLCEMDPAVIQVAKKYYPTYSRALADSRTTVINEDGALYVQNNKKRFDIIICDSSDPVGPAKSLFEESFYSGMRGALRKGGIVCTQGECMWLHMPLISKVIKFGRNLYKSCEYVSVSIPSYPSGTIGCILAAKNADTDLKKQCRSLKSAMGKKNAKSLLYYSKKIHKSSFVLPAFARDLK